MINGVYRFAIAAGLAKYNPVAELAGAMQTVSPTHFAAITDPKYVGPLMLAIDAYEGSIVVRNALRISALLFQRPGEIRTMKWSELDLREALWTRSGSTMKSGSDHLVPLPTQAINLLRELEPLAARGEFVFPSQRGPSRPMSENTVRIALRTSGYDAETMTAHGFRAMARTILDEVLEFPVDWIEHQLAHQVKDANGRAYNLTRFLEQRAEMLQSWANYLDHLQGLAAQGRQITRNSGREHAFNRARDASFSNNPASGSSGQRC